MIILTKEIGFGKTILHLDIATLHTGTPIDLPVIIQRAKKLGPTVLLTAGIKGNEINGVEIVRQIIRKKYNVPAIGTIICIPVVNVFGFINQERAFPDGRDLNRMFPGSLNGSLASQFAHQFTKEIAPFVDYVIDYHTGGGERDNITQIRLDTSEEKTLELANVFNPPFIVHSSYIAKSLRESLKKMGKTVLLFEGGKSKNLDPIVIDHGIRGTKNVLTHLGFIDGDISLPLKPTFIKKAKWLRSNHSGMFKILVENGIHVKKKDILGVIQDPFGEFKKNIYAPFDCYIFCINKTPIVNKGEALFHVSIDE